MKKIRKPLILSLLAIFIAIQFVHPDKNINTTGILSSNDIGNVYPMPPDIQEVLKTSCYDCHSDNTSYPWYSKIQPMAWWLNDHILEGKKELDFSEFGSYRVSRQYKKMEEIIEQVKDDDMPLSSYTLIHRGAVLSKEQKLSLANWATVTRDTIKARYPADSLTKKVTGMKAIN